MQASGRQNDNHGIVAPGPPDSLRQQIWRVGLRLYRCTIAPDVLLEILDRASSVEARREKVSELQNEEVGLMIVIMLGLDTVLEPCTPVPPANRAGFAS